MIISYLRSIFDYALRKQKTALPTRYHYVELLRHELILQNVSLSTLGKHCIVLTEKTSGRSLCIVVRYTTDQDLILLREAKKNNCKIAYLIDDDYWAMLESKDLIKDYRDRLRIFLDTYFEQLTPLLDVIVAPSRQILDRFPEIPGVKMQPAHLSPSRDLSHFDAPEQIRLAFLGTSTHSSDLYMIAPGIKKALTENPRLHLTTLLGERGKLLIPSGPRVTHLGKMFFPRFNTWVATQRFHIGLAPYEPNQVNNGRSYLKFHQHAQIGAAGLYSMTTPFLECVEDGVNGMFLAPDAQSWADGISTLATDWKTTRSMAQKSIEKSVDIQSHAALANTWVSLI